MFELSESDEWFIANYCKDPEKREKYIADIKATHDRMNAGKPDRPDIKVGEPQVLSAGEFTTSGKIWVSDPCYEIRLPRSNHIIEHASPGLWSGTYLLSNEGMFHGHPDIRVRELVVKHNDSFEIEPSLAWVHEKKVNIDVDSGSAGFFDLAEREKLPEGRREEPEWQKWYDECFKARYIEGKYNRKMGWHESWSIAGPVRGWGVVSSSGWGDGGYDLYTKRLLGFVVAAKIVFISDEEDENEE
jgi:hypothetical protein